MLDINPGMFFGAVKVIRTKGHRYKIFKKATGSFGRRFFGARVVESWNKLKAQTMEAKTVDEFQIGLESEGD